MEQKMQEKQAINQTLQKKIEMQEKQTSVQTQQSVETIANHLVKEVEGAVTSLIARGGLDVPKDYSVVNSIRSAVLILQEMMDRDKKPVLQSCSRSSIISSLLSMIVQGLNPIKKQCYFVPYGGKLVFMRSYAGNIALARRVGLKRITANVIRKGEKFVFENKPDGRCEIIEHKTSLETLDNEIIGAYAVIEMADGWTTTVIMTAKQIKQAWMQGINYRENAGGVHDKFGDEMAKKTIINRACKLIINSSPDFVNEIDEEINDSENEINENEIAINNLISIDEPTKNISELDNTNNEVKPENNEIPF